MAIELQQRDGIEPEAGKDLGAQDSIRAEIEFHKVAVAQGHEQPSVTSRRAAVNEDNAPDQFSACRRRHSLVASVEGLLIEAISRLQRRQRFFYNGTAGIVHLQPSSLSAMASPVSSFGELETRRAGLVGLCLRQSHHLDLEHV